MKSRAKRTSCRTSRHRLCCLTATCSTAWERDDVWLAAVGSCVRCLLPFISNSMIWKHTGGVLCYVWSSWAGLSLNVLIGTNEKLCHAWLAGLSDLLCVDGRHLCDASNLNHSFWVFSQVQEAWGWVQQVTDHLIVDLKRQIKKKRKCQLNTNWPSSKMSLWS